MDKNITNLNSTYTQWIIALIAEICEGANMQPSELSINEVEVKAYYDNGNTPSIVYNQIWQGDAGNFYAI